MRKGFTLIELMIVIAIIAIIAAIAVPNLLENRLTANESGGNATLKSGVFSGQVTFQGASYQDTDNDNVGEYGHLADLAGARATTGVPANNLTLLQGALGQAVNNNFAANTEAHYISNGYAYAAFTASADGTALINESLDLADPITENMAEQNWKAAAAPERYGQTGRRVFVIGDEGEPRSASNLVNIEVWYGGSSGDGAILQADPILPDITAAAGGLYNGLLDATGTATTANAPWVAAYPVYTK